MGVHESTVRADLTPAAGNPAPAAEKPNEIKGPESASAGFPAPAPIRHGEPGYAEPQPSARPVLSGAEAQNKAERANPSGVHTAANSGENEWYTKAPIIEAARAASTQTA